MLRPEKFIKYLTCLWFILVSPAWAAIPELPGNNQALANDKVDDSANIAVPDPANLKANWWRYLDVDPATLKQRLPELTKKLYAWQAAIPEEAQPDAKSQIDRFVANMDILLDLKQKPLPVSPEAITLEKTYTLNQWLAKAHQYRNIHAELQSLQEDIGEDQQYYDSLRQRFDTMTADYLGILGQSSHKTLRGLSLMAAWSELAVKGRYLEQQKTLAKVQSERLSRLQEQDAVIQQRLTINPDEKNLLTAELEKANRELETAQEIAKRQANSTVGNVEDETGKVKVLLYEQQYKLALIRQDIADAEVNRIKLGLLLAQLLTVEGKVNLSGIKESFLSCYNRFNILHEHHRLWLKEAERDQTRTGKSLAGLAEEENSKNAPIFKYSQQRLAEIQKILLALQQLDNGLKDNKLVAEYIGNLIATKEGKVNNNLNVVKTTTSQLVSQFWEQMGQSLFKIGDTPVTVSGILRFALILGMAWSMSHFVRRGLMHLDQRQQGSLPYFYTLGRLAHYAILAIGLSIALSSVGIDLTNFAMIAGALSLGIGFGMQAIVSNFVSGLIVLFERSIRIGDFIELSSGLAGEVRAINVRSTLVTTPDMIDILVPNSEFVNGKVINWTLTDVSRRIHIPFGVAYGSDKETVRQAALEAADNTPHTLKSGATRNPEVWLTHFGDSSLDFELVVWINAAAVKKPQRVRAAYYWELETALRKYGIEIPFPQQDLHIRSGLSPQKEKNSPMVNQDDSPKLPGNG